MKSKIKVFVSGQFNVLHPGHLRLFRFAKEHGDCLLVGVNSDRIAGHDAYIPQDLRMEGVKSNSYVDQIYLIDEPVSQVIDRLRPDIVVKGIEHQFKYNPELVSLEKYGGRLIFSSGEATFSSLDLIKKEFLVNDVPELETQEDYLRRHSIEGYRIKHLLNSFSRVKVCVIGDLIIDEYITCQPLGMSQEDPTIVVTPLDATKFIGGAGIVAAHAAGLGGDVEFISVTGEDDSRGYATKKLDEYRVNSHLYVDISRPTILKQRYRTHGKNLFRVSYLHQGAVSLELQSKILEKFKAIAGKVDVLVLSDFNYGCLPQGLVEALIKIAKSFNIFIAADSQSSSQIGDVSRFIGVDLLTPTEHEARVAMRNQEDGLVVLSQKLKEQTGSKNIFLKMGREGLLIHADTESPGNAWLTDKINAMNPTPKDVAGAGDSLLIVSSMAMALGANVWEAAYLGSIAAGIQVGRVGNTPLKLKEIQKELDQQNF